jgi:hypothetical protein
VVLGWSPETFSTKGIRQMNNNPKDPNTQENQQGSFLWQLNLIADDLKESWKYFYDSLSEKEMEQVIHMIVDHKTPAQLITGQPIDELLFSVLYGIHRPGTILIDDRNMFRVIVLSNSDPLSFTLTRLDNKETKIFSKNPDDKESTPEDSKSQPDN